MRRAFDLLIGFGSDREFPLWDGVVGAHRHALAAGCDAFEREFEAAEDAVFFDGVDGIIGAGGAVSAPDVVAAERMQVGVIGVYGADINADRDLLLRGAHPIGDDKQDERRKQRQVRSRTS